MKTQQQADRIKGGSDGWIPANEVWSFGSADQPIFELTIPGDKTAKYSKGMKLKLEQSQALTSLWDLTANANDSIGANNGTLEGSPTFNSGKFSTNALTLNGSSQFVALPDLATLKPAGDFTVGVWIKTAVDNENIFSSRNSATVVNGFTLYIIGGKLFVQTGKNTGTTISEFSVLTGSTTLTDNIWHYLVFTLKDTTGQIYVDGKLDSAGYVMRPVFPSPNYPRIGDLYDGGEGGFFNGQIQDLFFINGYALDEKTIYDKYISNTPQSASAINVTKNFLVNSVLYSNPNTIISLYGGTDFSLSNSIISNPYYSMEESPFGYNVNPFKWGKLNDATLATVKIKIAKFTGTMALTGDTFVNIVHGLDSSKFISINGICFYGGTTFGVPDSYLTTDGYEFCVLFDNIYVNVKTSTSNSSVLYGKPFVITVLYTTD